uniref:Osteocrin isoform X2 n=1 Tax=Pogona vitticeps TaxID=103695 RepID=A0ABM5G4B7_9SAUR
MLPSQRAAGYLVLAITLFQWPPEMALQAEALQEQQQQQLPFGRSLAQGMVPPSPSHDEKSAMDLASKLLLLDELVSLENDVGETKKKRSFSGFGSPLDRLSAGSVDLKTKQRKVVDLPKRRFGIPLDRIGGNRLNNSRDLPALMDAVSRRAPGSEDASVSPGLLTLPLRNRPSKKCNPPLLPSNKP